MHRKLIVAALVACLVSLLLCAGCSRSSQSVQASYSTAKDPASQTSDFTGRVKEYLQMPDLAGGCEIASLMCVLEAMGLDVDVDDLIENHLPLNEGSSFASSFIGSPYIMGSGYPPVLMRCANSYLAKEGARIRAISMVGCSFDDVVREVEQGRPVMVWTTMEMAPVMHSQIYSDGFEWYDNEHCVVVYGMDDDGVKVSDPLDGLVVRDEQAFREIFDDCGGLAVTFYTF